MLQRCADGLKRGQIPQSDGPVCVSDHELRTVGAKEQILDHALIDQQRADGLERRRIPQLRGPVVASRQNLRTIGTKGQGPGSSLMAAKFTENRG